MTTDRKSLFFGKPVARWGIFLAVSIALATGLVSFFHLLMFRSNVQTQPQKASKTAPARVAVTALGRLVPDGEVTQLSAPSSLTGVRVEKLLVKEGDEIKAGQVVALLEGYARSLAAVQQAVDNVQVAQAKLAQVKAGAKTGDINAQKAAIAQIEWQLQGEVNAQKAAIASLQAQVNNAQTENARYQQLYKEGAVSASTAASKSLQLETLQQQLTEAKATLNRTVDTLQEQLREAKAKLGSIKEVRPTDVRLAEAELKTAISAVKKAKAEHDLTYVKSPIDGKVLKVHAKSGEVVASTGIIEVGKTSQMHVIAEVYQTDIQKVRVGQKAIITSTAFPGKKLQGTVSEIGLVVDRQNILSINPGADTDRRVIQVKIRIDNPADSQQVAGLTNLQVDVAIKI